MKRTLLLFLMLNFLAVAEVYEIGPDKKYTKASQVMNKVNDGDTVLIESGTYEGDVGVWRANDLLVRGMNGMAHLKAAGKNAQGKGIWVSKGDNITYENIEFSGAAVPDKNGAGIRLDGSGLTVRNCYFHHNENGILAGIKDPESDILIEYCEFAYNGHGDGYSHNLYINRANSLTFRFNYSHHAKIGHNLKTRANTNKIMYNFISDSADGNSSMLIDISNGGNAYIIGNLLVQGPNAENSSMITYGLEGLQHPENHLMVINNTMVNKRHKGIFVNTNQNSDEVRIINNILTGNSATSGQAFKGKVTESNNIAYDDPDSLRFTDRNNIPYHLSKNSPAVNIGHKLEAFNDVELIPEYEYKHKSGREEKTIYENLDMGAFEYPGETSINTQLSEIKIYPNPADDHIIIKKAGFGNTVKLLDILSNEVISLDKKDDKMSLDISGLMPGMYFLIIEKNGKIYNKKKIIVE